VVPICTCALAEYQPRYPLAHGQRSAQVLRRDDALATDDRFGLKLADLLQQALAEQVRMERTSAGAGGDGVERTLARELAAAEALASTFST